MLADGLFLVRFPTGFARFGLLHCQVFLLVFGRCFHLIQVSLYIGPLVTVFSARALAAGFRPGACHTVSNTLTIGRTERKFLRPYLWLHVIFVPTISA